MDSTTDRTDQADHDRTEREIAGFPGGADRESAGCPDAVFAEAKVRGFDPPPRRGWRSWFPQTALVALCWAVYINGVNGMFVFDDASNITDNPAVKSLIPYDDHWGWLGFAPRRCVLYFTMALNYAAGGADSRGYHVVNILIHMTAALALYGVVRRTLRTARLRARYGGCAEELAFAVAMVWMVHPIQTQSVTYVVQRTESLMGMFYLLLFYCTVRGSQSSRPMRWYILAVYCCLLGGLTKEVMITAPVLLYLYDAVFLGDSWFAPLRRRWGLYLACCVSLVPLIYFTLCDIFSPKIDAQGFGSKIISSPEFARSQPGVILHYLWIIAWPKDLCLDYRWPVAVDLREIARDSVAVGAMVLLSLGALAWRKPVGFVGFLFFLTLAPTSTVIPIIDLAFEHRLYLPLAGPVLLAVFGGEALLRRLSEALGRPAWVMGALAPALVALWAGMLSGRTIVRNFDYVEDVRIWADVVRQRPNNPRGYHNLAVAQEHAGKLEEALKNYKICVEVVSDPLFGKGHSPVAFCKNYANLLGRMGRNAEALEAFKRCTKFNSGYAEAYYGMGLQYAVMGDLQSAAENYEKAIQLHEDFYPGKRYRDVRRKLGEILVKLGRWQEALDNQLILMDKPTLVTEIDPEPPEQVLTLARAQAGLGKIEAAISNYQSAFDLLDPDKAKGLAADAARIRAQAHADAATELAWLLATTHDAARRDGAAAEKLARAGLAGGGDRARRALAAALAEQGRFDEALELLPKEGEAGDSEEVRREREWLRLKRPFRADPPSPGNPVGEPSAPKKT